MAGTVTRSGDSIGSVRRPQSAVPARMAARQRSVAPAQILISDCGWARWNSRSRVGKT